jgi:hypothetical protein
MQGLAFAFRPFVAPDTRCSLPTTLAICAQLQLTVGVPYAANECRAFAPAVRTALRGLIVGICACFTIGPMFLVNAPTLVRGGFHRRYLLSVPITLIVAVGVAFIPIDGSTLGIIPIGVLTVALSFVLCMLLLNAACFATEEHKALDQNFGPPLFAIIVLFFGLITAYVTLTQLYFSPWIGLLLPVGSAVTRVLGLFALVRSFRMFYYAPKERFITQFATSAQAEAPVEPPILGDVEVLYTMYRFMLCVVRCSLFVLLRLNL